MDRVGKLYSHFFSLKELQSHWPQYGIEFGYVGGDPAELMRICVENGMFTVSFLKEGLQKVWLISILNVLYLSVRSNSSVAGWMTCSRRHGRHVKALMSLLRALPLWLDITSRKPYKSPISERSL